MSERAEWAGKFEFAVDWLMAQRLRGNRGDLIQRDEAERIARELWTRAWDVAPDSRPFSPHFGLPVDRGSQPSRTTGSWVVLRRTPGDTTCWLEDSPNDSDLVRAFCWGGEPNARAYPNKTAAQRAIRGYRRYPGEVIEIVRSFGHEAQLEAERHKRESAL